MDQQAPALECIAMRTFGHIHDGYGQQNSSTPLFARQGRLLRKTAYPVEVIPSRPEKQRLAAVKVYQIKTRWMMNQEPRGIR